MECDLGTGIEDAQWLTCVFLGCGSGAERLRHAVACVITVHCHQNKWSQTRRQYKNG